jgi:hypothetical protein
LVLDAPGGTASDRIFGKHAEFVVLITDDVSEILGVRVWLLGLDQ